MPKCYKLLAWITLPATLCLTAGSFSWAQTIAPSSVILRENRAQHWLVQAKATTITKIPSQSAKIISWDVEHVFNGPRDLLGKKFVFDHRPRISSPFGRVPSADVNDRGLWLVQYDGLDLVPSSGNGNLSYGLRLPIIENHPQLMSTRGFAHPEQTRKINLDFAEALPQAQTIERLTTVPRQEQIRLLTLNAKGIVPKISAWAIETLAQDDVPGTVPLLLSFVNDPNIPVAGQIALDQALETLDRGNKAQWNQTQARSGLWERLVNSSASEEDAVVIVNGIGGIHLREKRARLLAEGDREAYKPTVQDSQLLEWLRAASVNAKWTLQLRNYALEQIAKLTG